MSRREKFGLTRSSGSLTYVSGAMREQQVARQETHLSQILLGRVLLLQRQPPLWHGVFGSAIVFLPFMAWPLSGEHSARLFVAWPLYGQRSVRLFVAWLYVAAQRRLKEEMWRGALVCCLASQRSRCLRFPKINASRR